MKALANIICASLTTISLNCCPCQSGIKSREIKSKKNVLEPVNFQEIAFCGYYDVTKRQLDLDRLNFIFGFDPKTQSKYFGSKIRVFKLGLEERLEDVPSYIIVMLDEVKNRVVNEEVKLKLFEINDGIKCFSCLFNGGKFCVMDIYTVVRINTGKPLFHLHSF